MESPFVLRVRHQGETHFYRFTGAEARELHQLREHGQLERPGGTRRLTDLVRDREPDSRLPGGSTNAGEADFDMVADEELRGWLSSRLLERRGARENGPGLDVDAPGARVDDPSPA